MGRPLFSIITITFNAAGTLPATLKSVERQTFTDYEYLIAVSYTHLTLPTN